MAMTLRQATFIFLFALLQAVLVQAHAPVITIPLDKQYVPVQRNGRIISYKTAYFGRIHLGFPRMAGQTFTVVFDTGSGHLFLPAEDCETETCRRHRRYSRQASPSAVDIDHDGEPVHLNATERDQVAVRYGTGEVTGEFVRETVCLDGSDRTAPRGADCAEVRVILATEMTEEPFQTFEFDGVLGLGLETLAVDPEFSFLGQFSKLQNLAESRFGYFLSRSDTVPSEISFGGHDQRRIATELQWAPVHRPELGYWQMKLKSVSVGDKKLNVCEDGGCVAIADTGTSLLGAPRQAAQRLHWLLARPLPTVPDKLAEIDCRSFPGPDLVFELEGGVKISLGPEDYSRATAMQVMQSKTNTSQVICRASLLPVDEAEILGPKAFILGEPALRKYYTAYDWRNQQIGFALAVQPQDGDAPAGEPQHTIFGAPPRQPPTPTTVHV